MFYVIGAAMPGWILVANRFLFSSTIRNNGGALSGIALLACLLVLSGCSNIRQQSLDSSLPILPSQAAAIGDDAPLLGSKEDGTVSGNPVESNSAQDVSALAQDPVESGSTVSEFNRHSSVQSFLSAENDFQPQSQQPSARFVDVLGKAEMGEVKLTAVPSNTAPAPAIGSVSHQAEVVISNTPEACDTLEECKNIEGCKAGRACNEKVASSKLAFTGPLDANQHSELIGTDHTTTENKNIVPHHSLLQPLNSTSVEPSPIRLIATPDLKPPVEVRLPSSSATAELPQTQSEVQLRISTAPDAQREFALESDPVAARRVHTLESKRDIEVRPIFGLNSATLETSPAGGDTVAKEERLAGSTDVAQSNRIPVSSEIRVSAVSFEDLRTTFPKPSDASDEPVAESAPVFEPIATEKVTQSVKPVKTDEFVDLARNELEPSNTFLAEPDLADSLPDMPQIEKDIDDFKKLNTFDPSMVIDSERIDPNLLLEKLDGPSKKYTSPRVGVADSDPHNDLIKKQLDAQGSVLLKIQEEIKQLKPEPVAVIHEDPELKLNNPAFCTKISGFGQFKPFVANNFSSSQRTLLYCEVENQTSKQFTSVDGSQQFETVLRGAIVIYDVNDQIVQTAKFPVVKDVARQRRRDFYVYFPVQFDGLASGEYRLELNIEDVASNKTAVFQPFMKFSVR